MPLLSLKVKKPDEQPGSLVVNPVQQYSGVDQLKIQPVAQTPNVSVGSSLRTPDISIPRYDASNFTPSKSFGDLLGDAAKSTGSFLKESFVDPTLRGGQALTDIQNNMIDHRPAFQNINKKQLTSDFVNTALLGAPASKTIELLKGAAPIANRLLTGALEGAGYGAVQGGVTAFGQNATPGQIAGSAVEGAGLGALGGAAIPLVGAAGAKVGEFSHGLGERGSVPIPGPSTTLPSEVNDSLTAAAKAEADKYKQNPVVAAKNAVVSALYDPAAELQRIDQRNAASQGVKLRDLPAEQRLTHLWDQTVNSSTAADQLMHDTGLKSIIQKYGEGTPEGKTFMNYLNARFALEVHAKGNKQIIPNVSNDDLKTLVAGYEAHNPGAQHDAQLVKSHFDTLLDHATSAGVINEADAKFVKSHYENYVPLDRVFAEDLQRPQMSGAPTGSLGRQSILQNIEGGTQPLDNSFGVLTGRTNSAMRQVARNNLANKVKDLHAQGLVEGNLLVDPAKVEAKQKLAEQYGAIKDTIKQLQSYTRRQSANVRVAKAGYKATKAEAVNKVAAATDKQMADLRVLFERTKTNAARKEGSVRVVSGDVNRAQAAAATKTKQVMRGLLQGEPDATAALNAMSRDQLLTTFQDLVSENTPNIERLRSNLVQVDKRLGVVADRLAEASGKTQDAAAAITAQRQQGRDLLSSLMPGKNAAINSLNDQDLLKALEAVTSDGSKTVQASVGRVKDKNSVLNGMISDLQTARETTQGLRQAKGDIRSDMAELSNDPTTGKQVVSGFTNGTPFKLEVSPELGKVLQGLGQERLPTLLRFTQNALVKPFQTAFTGFLNPAFSLISFALYDAPISVINSAAYGGIRTVANTLRPKAFGEMFRSINSSNEFQQALNRAGRMQVGGSQLALDAKSSAASIAAQKNLFTRAKFDATNPEAALHNLDAIGGKLANATRSRVARGAYEAGLQRGMNPDQAINEAVQAYNNVLPNYRRVGDLAKQINAVLPYTSASLAGTRSLLYAMKNHPAAIAGVVAGGVAPAVAVTMYNLSQQEGHAFYDDMAANKKGYLFDNNLVFVMPGAHRNSDGSWEGIVKIPVPPEFRSVNKIAWRQTHDAVMGNGLTDPLVYAGAAFDFMTGQITGNDSPAANLGFGLATNTNMATGNPIVPENQKDLPAGQQINKGTGVSAIELGKILNISPEKIQYAINQFGTPGKQVEALADKGLVALGAPNADHQMANNPVSDLTNRFQGAYGSSDGANFYKFADDKIASISDEQDKKLAESMVAKNGDKTFLDTPQKSLTLLNSLKGNGQLFQFSKDLDAYDRSQGKPGNPFFDLSKDQQQKVLLYQSAKALRTTKQDYDKNGSALYNQLGLDQGWYQDYQKQNTAFYTALNLKPDSSAPKTASGTEQPVASDALQSIMNTYNALPQGTGDRSAWIKANPDAWAQMQTYFQASDAFANQERAALGLAPLTPYDSSGSGSKYASNGSSGSTKNSISMSSRSGVGMPSGKISVKKPGVISVKKHKFKIA